LGYFDIYHLTSNKKSKPKLKKVINMNSRYNFSVVRILRHCQGLTLKELAAKSGVTYTTLENVETNKATPSLKTLDAIAGGLEISTSELVSLSENQIVQRRKAKFVTGEFSGKINPGIDNCKVANFNKAKVLRVQAKKDVKVNVPQLHDNCNEICYVLSGCVDLTISGETYRLESDDSILFDGVLDHTFNQVETGEYITIHIPKDVSVIKDLLKQAEDEQVEQ
jgi:XRE family transcriptional regulator, regulator of sulfur utilization